ncbi:cell division protein FtsN [Haemophilus pittmaniae]|uniref:cell division protein FtsN n=1 Tax=Haemophilus pittmaniae TaxID=249188 RepID=UPI000B94E587|nr:cell division protein FtsN [Haemophilus pittmaniae]MBS6026727.1 cell division protein FtsN [Haemophilus pittmaniae]SNV71636.1 cell division protein FtsN [Haemophilus pittmaniae]
MAHRDFAARQRGNNKKKKGKKANKTLLILIALAVVIAFAGGLFLLRSKTPEPVTPAPAVVEKTQPKSVLPNRPEEVWSYIQALETRTVPVDNNQNSVEKNMRLTKEQREVLLQMEKEQKAQEAKKLEAQAKAELAAKVEAATKTETAATPAQVVKPEAVKKTEPVKKPEVKVETAQQPQPKNEPAKIETAKKAEVKTDAASGEKKFGLQCGAFKNRTQAESLQGRLAMVGVNAQVVVSGEWNRVRVGPFASRDGAVQVQEKAKSVIGCVVIGM